MSPRQFKCEELAPLQSILCISLRSSKIPTGLPLPYVVQNKGLDFFGREAFNKYQATVCEFFFWAVVVGNTPSPGN